MALYQLIRLCNVHQIGRHNLLFCEDRIYEVCSKSIRIGIVVVVHWEECV
jgi:hypothetical protein